MERSLDSWEKEVIRCIRCGSCQNVCPVFRELQAESTVARGRVKLIRGVIEKEMSLTEGFGEKMSLCLMCKACAAGCPSGVKVDKIIEAARTEIVDRKGLSPLKKLIFRLVLKNRRIFNSGMFAGRIFQGVLFRPGQGGEGMLPRMPLGIDRRRLLTPLAAKSLRELYPEVVPAQESGSVPGSGSGSGSVPRLRAAFFTGCMINYIYTDTGKAVINVLNRLGVEVVIPALQSCCGTPARINGDIETARDMARANIDVLLKADVDTIVVACGTCGLALKEEYSELLKDDPKYAGKAAALGGKVRDFTELVVFLGGFGEIGGIKISLESLPLKVTYHDPCHLVRGLKVKEQPRQLIRQIPGLEFREMKKPDTCCGSGGSFSLAHYELSKKINDRKVEDILETGAEIVVTGCSACRMHILDGLNRQEASAQEREQKRARGRVQVMHTAQLLELALEAGKQT